MGRLWVGLGGLCGATAVGMAAVAAHAGLSPVALEVLRSAVQMQGWHALALLFLGIWRDGLFARLAGAAFVLGVLLFCGSLYALAFAGLRAPLAPAGGILLMLGWVLVALSAVRRG